MMTRTLSTILVLFCLAVTVSAQGRYRTLQRHKVANQVPAINPAEIDEEKLDKLAQAIAGAEGFGIRHAIPTRYHNPGDLRIFNGKRLPGQVGLARNKYAIFKNDAAGFAALKTLLVKVASNQTTAYKKNSTLLQLAKVYAGDWRHWSKNVSHNLGDVPLNTSIREYIRAVDVQPDLMAANIPLLLPDSLTVVKTAAPVLEDANTAAALEALEFI